jgi:hypothetical protein
MLLFPSAAAAITGGGGTTVTTAAPLTVPPHPLPSVSVRAAYVVVAFGWTARVIVAVGVPSAPAVHVDRVCSKPSDQRTVHGGAPVSTAEISAVPPCMIVCEPLTFACDRRTETVPVPGLWQVPTETVTSRRTTLAEQFAWNVTDEVPEPCTITPPSTVHA